MHSASQPARVFSRIIFNETLFVSNKFVADTEQFESNLTLNVYIKPFQVNRPSRKKYVAHSTIPNTADYLKALVMKSLDEGLL